MKKLQLISLFLLLAAIFNLKANNADTNIVKADTQKVHQKLTAIDTFVYSKLDRDQIMELEMTKLGAVKHPDNEDNNQPLYNMLTALGFFITVILLTLIFSIFKHKKDSQLYNVYIKTLDMGKEMPVELIHRKQLNYNNLQKGILLIGLGIGVLCIGPHGGIWGHIGILGCIPIFSGISFLIMHIIERKQQKQA